MPFKPVRLLIAYDPAGGACAKVVPRMKRMLEDRAFVVDTHEIDGAPVDVEAYRGIIFGTPVSGIGVRHGGPTQKVEDFIRGLEGLDEKKVCVFAVYDVSLGSTFDKMKNQLIERGAEFVAEHGFWRMRPQAGEHIIPAECMIRIRT